MFFDVWNHNKYMKSNFLKGALVLIICNLVGKVLGAVYRIPLAGILGPVGMGMYQLVFPLYCLILTISTSGMPVAISKLVAENNSKNQFNNSKKILKISLLILTVISFIGAVLVVCFAKFISKIQGNINIFICYYGIAPAILFVGMLSAFRGYFQGNLLMFPTALSSLVENIVKMILGLIFANRLVVFGVEYAVLGALVGVSISELISVIFLLICYFIFNKKKNKKSEFKSESFKFLTRQIFSLAIPVTLGGLIAPITAMVDSLLIVNLLMFSGFSNTMATTMLGIQSGIVEPLVNIPVIIAVSISMVLLPNISKFSAENSRDKIKNIIENSFQISLCISLTCAICFVIFGEQILKFLYGSALKEDEIMIATKLLFLGGFNIIFLSMVQVTAGALQGLGKTKEPVKSLIVGCIVKIVLDIVLVLIRPINIYGSVISGAVCYFVVFMLNYLRLKRLINVNLKDIFFYISIQECLVCLFAFFANKFCILLFSETVSMFVAGVITIAVFFVTYYVFFVYGKKDLDFEEKQI